LLAARCLLLQYWMHPSRFRAQLCSFGKDCNRRICFFAHTQEQLRIPSEPVVADALAIRAPYLQGRVAPESRYALYPDQVPQMVPVQGGRMLTASGQHQHMQQQQQQLLVRAEMPGMQMVYMPAGAPQAVALAQHGQAAGLPGSQQWAPASGVGGSSVVLVPAGQAGGGGSMGYYAVQQPGAAAGPASQETYSTGMLVAPGMQLLGGSYGTGQPLQLVAALPGDGGMPQYATVHPSDMQGAQVAYAPVFAAPGGGMTMQQWGGQEQQPAPPPPHALLPGQVVPMHQQQQQRGLSQHHAHHQPHSQQQLQLVVAEPAADAAAAGHSARQQQEGTYILTPSGQLAPTRGQLEAPYAVMAAGPTGMMQQQACSSMPGSSQGAVEQGGSAPCPPSVDEIAQQMAGWGIQ
jgi:hypothetical protein